MALVAMAIMLLAPVVESNAQISRDYRHSESYQDAVNRAADGIKGLFSKKGSKKKSDKSQDKNASSPAAQSRDLQKDEIKLVVSGDGATKDQATRSALRSAIEQTYGTFVSSNTVILNDELVKDEIATVASGNIKSFNYISENEKDGKYYVTLETVVSIGKLISYAKSKGSEAELAGATFAMDIKMKKINEQNQNTAIDNMMQELTHLIRNGFDYEISTSDPKQSSEYEKNLYEVTFSVDVSINKNMVAAHELFNNTLDVLALSPAEYKDYLAKNLPWSYVGDGDVTIDGHRYSYKKRIETSPFWKWALRGKKGNEFGHESMRRWLVSASRQFCVTEVRTGEATSSANRRTILGSEFELSNRLDDWPALEFLLFTDEPIRDGQLIVTYSGYKKYSLEEISNITKFIVSPSINLQANMSTIDGLRKEMKHEK